MAKVMVFGTFDGLHIGHLAFLNSAANLGDLHVVVARSQTVFEVKERFPQRSERVRMSDIRRAGFKPILGCRYDKYFLIKKIQPDIVCLGYDQKAYTDKLESKLNEFGLKTSVIRLPSFYPEYFKSSKLNKALPNLDGNQLDKI